MRKNNEVTSLEQLLARIDEAAQDSERVCIDTLMEVAGGRSFGPLLLVVGLATLAPVIGDIPGVPTIMGVVVLLTALQLLFGRKHLWLPRWLLKRSVPSDKLRKAISWMQRPAKFVDRLLHERLTLFTRGAGVYAIAIACVIIGAAMPAMEVIPFSANVAGAALTAFGLSLIARDGLMALIAFLCTAIIAGLLAYNLL